MITSAMFCSGENYISFTNVISTIYNIYSKQRKESYTCTLSIDELITLQTKTHYWHLEHHYLNVVNLFLFNIDILLPKYQKDQRQYTDYHFDTKINSL